jgi:proline iminopeptidase
VRAPYAIAEPYDEGLLDVGDGQRIFFEQCGTPAGKPALVLHGGPGSGCVPAMRGLFDPAAYRVVLADQRGAGRSLPHASDPAADLAVVTTAHLVADLERLRVHLGIDRWLVLGRSWGCTLALAYAQAHPRRVTELVLASVTTTSAAEVDWLVRGAGRFLPAEWEALRDGVPAADRGGDLAAAYARLLASPDAGVRERAARDWCAWEQALVAGEGGAGPDPRYDDARFRLGFARQVTHAFAHAAFLEDGRLLRDAHRLAAIPGVLLHGRRDLSAPPDTAWRLARAWPGSELTLLDGAGHTSPELADHVVAATDRFAAGDRRRP